MNSDSVSSLMDYYNNLSFIDNYNGCWFKNNIVVLSFIFMFVNVYG